MTHNVLRTFSAKSNAPVTFTTLDAATAGNWAGVYSSNNYVIADSTSLTNLSTNIVMAFAGQTTQVWTNFGSDPRALLRPGSSTNRIAAAWTSPTNQGSSFTIDVSLTGTNLVSLYCVDWLGSGTILERIELFDYADSAFANALDVRSFTMPSNGVYLSWKLSGHKVLRVRKSDALAGNKAMVSALFFEPVQ